MGTRANNKATGDHNIQWDDAECKWRVRIIRNGQTYQVGRFVDRPTARAARDAFLETLGAKPQVAARQTSEDAKLRMTALRAARVQFTAASPMDLIKAAEQLYLWLKHGESPSADEPLEIGVQPDTVTH